MKITIIGTGYVGLVTGVCLASKGHDVICVDNRSEVVVALNDKLCPIYENGLEPLFKRTIGEKLHVSASIQEAMTSAELVMVTVGTPLKDGDIDLSAVEAVAEEIGRGLKEARSYVVVVVKSTVVPTTTEEHIIPILESSSGKKAGQDFGVCMNPEFLREGEAVQDCLAPDRIVIGAIDEKSGGVVERMYAGFEAPILKVNPRTAEMIKYTSNSLLAAMISFTNEIANLCARIPGLDIENVMEAVHLDHRINPLVNGARVNPGIMSYLMAGCGFGGSCFPKDVKSLAVFSQRYGINSVMLNAVIDVNFRQPRETIDLLKRVYPDIKGRTIAVLGLAFKPGTDDIRESAAIKIVKLLLKEGARLKVFDPIVSAYFNKEDGQVLHADTWEHAITGADAVIVATMWDEFRCISQDDLCRLMRNPVIIDGRRAFEKRKFQDVTYLGVGYSGREH